MVKLNNLSPITGTDSIILYIEAGLNRVFLEYTNADGDWVVGRTFEDSEVITLPLESGVSWRVRYSYNDGTASVSVAS